MTETTKYINNKTMLEKFRQIWMVGWVVMYKIEDYNQDSNPPLPLVK